MRPHPLLSIHVGASHVKGDVALTMWAAGSRLLKTEKASGTPNDARMRLWHIKQLWTVEWKKSGSWWRCSPSGIRGVVSFDSLPRPPPVVQHNHTPHCNMGDESNAIVPMYSCVLLRNIPSALLRKSYPTSYSRINTFRGLEFSDRLYHYKASLYSTLLPQEKNSITDTLYAQLSK